MIYTFFKGQGIAILLQTGHSCPSATSLFIGHTDGPIVGGIGIAITGIEHIEELFRKIQPAFFIEITRIVLADQHLHAALPWFDNIMKGLCGGSKVIRGIDGLLMKVHMYLWHPPAILNSPLL